MTSIEWRTKLHNQLNKHSKKQNIGIIKIIKYLNILKEIEKALDVHRLEELKVLVLHIIQSGPQM